MNLVEESEKIASSVEDYIQDLKKQRDGTVAAIEQKTQELKEASKTDTSENAEYTELLEKAQQLRASLANLNAQLKSVEVGVSSKKYVPIGMVILNSTVLLRDKSGEEFIFKVFPDNVSDVDRRMLAKNSAIGQAIWLKEKGAVFSVEHAITGEPIIYTIEDIY